MKAKVQEQTLQLSLALKGDEKEKLAAIDFHVKFTQTNFRFALLRINTFKLNKQSFLFGRFQTIFARKLPKRSKASFYENSYLFNTALVSRTFMFSLS